MKSLESRAKNPIFALTQAESQLSLYKLHLYIHVLKFLQNCMRDDILSLVQNNTSGYACQIRYLVSNVNVECIHAGSWTQVHPKCSG